MTDFSRRQLGLAALAGGTLAAAGGLVPGIAGAETIRRPFPKGFRWGAATAAYQIEGAPAEDGKGQSIWDVFSHIPGKIKDGVSGDVATDSYHRYAQDREALQGIGANSYRFSVAWPRIFPTGTGKPNMAGVDHYKRVVDDLLAHGIEPYVTLYHWDLPSALPGGWHNRDTAYRFADYAGFMAGQLGDRVKHFMTVNEIGTFLSSGYLFGDHAPGLKLPIAEVQKVRHHALLAHGLGVRAIRAHAPADTQIGIADNPRVPVPVMETPEHVAAARIAMRTLNNSILTPIMEGAYSPEFMRSPGGAAPVRDGDLAIIGSPLDFVALNIYSGVTVRADPGPQGFAAIDPPASYPKMILNWLNIMPDALYWGMRLTAESWHPKALYISENGAPSADKLVDGRVDDTDRIMYLRQYLLGLQRATAEGYPVKGYFAWSLLDNIEWAEGRTARFGLYYTDYETQQRIPKLSAAWFRQLATTGNVP